MQRDALQRTDADTCVGCGLCGPVAKAVRPYRKVKEVQFTSDPRVFNLMWDVRRGIIPSAGAMRPVSTSVILEGTSHRQRR